MKRILSSAIIALALPSDGQTIIGIMTDDENASVPFASVYNVTRQLGTMSNASGRFMIQAGAGDTLLFRCIGFRVLKLGLADTTSLTVHMERDTTELALVVILRPSLRQAILDLKLPEEKRVVVMDPYAVAVQRPEIQYPVMKPYPGIYMTYVPPVGAAVVISLDELIAEVKKRLPKPGRAKMLPRWE